ncbi:MAG TPA: cytochrome c-type biogenesis protein [Ramlibacter sp.]|nr:cytochrome c-type biogenesis protein [Ramlibacter sp.]
MNRFLALLIFALVVIAADAKEAAPMAEDPAIEQRLVAISEEMRCLVCQNESLSASRSDLAQDLRRELRTLIKQGKSDAEIREFMVARYGDFVLYRPQVKPVTWLLWFGPFVLMIAGVGVLLLNLRQRDTALAGADGTALTVEERRRAHALLQGGQE